LVQRKEGENKTIISTNLVWLLVLKGVLKFLENIDEEFGAFV
jgi:hypothetical protein